MFSGQWVRLLFCFSLEDSVALFAYLRNFPVEKGFDLLWVATGNKSQINE